MHLLAIVKHSHQDARCNDKDYCGLMLRNR